MRLSMKKSGNTIRYYAIRSLSSKGKRNTSEVVRKFGSHEELLQQDLGGLSPEQWCRLEIQKMTEEASDGKIFFALESDERLPLEEENGFSIGHFFPASLLRALGMEKLCQKISKAYHFDYSLEDIFSMLVCTRLLFPGSKKASLESYQRFWGKKEIQPHQVYRALEVFAQNSDAFQSELYKNSRKILPRKDKILYYDCTNFYFEMDQPDGFREFGISKEHRPNPLVQMGLFTDAQGIPLAFHLTPGNQNEQKTLKPLEKKILSDFDCAEFVVCTDAGLSSLENRIFNDRGGRAFVTTQSVKGLKKFLREWALDPNGWKRYGHKGSYCLEELEEGRDFDKIFYKERWTHENGLSQRLVVTYSLKRKTFCQTVRQGQIDRAVRALQRGAKGSKKVNPNDYRRFISTLSTTEEGEIATEEQVLLNEEQIQKEAQYDGFYAVYTNLEGDVSEILNVNKRRWQIEACFRVMKTDLSSRPIYLQKETRIRAHFLTCFVALLVLRLLEQILKDKGADFTSREILETLRKMEVTKAGEYFLPHFKRTVLTDALNHCFGMQTDGKVMTVAKLKRMSTSCFTYDK